jgi:hypothetical protein
MTDAALLVAHPGHELRLHHWLETARPRVFVLTDGSGGAAASRLAKTTAILRAAGAEPGSIYGRYSDRDLYGAMMSPDRGWVVDLAEELARGIAGCTVVAGDAAEGFSPSHDLARLLINAAVELVAARSGQRPENYEFPLNEGTGGDPSAPDRVLRRDDPGLTVRLDDAALGRKLAAARRYDELAHEVDHALEVYGPDAFRTEYLTPVRYGLDLDAVVPRPPYYETFGEGRVGDGRYREVLRYDRHFAPLAAALRRHIA